MRKTLPHELWSRVISFLVRDTPPPRTTKHWFDLHQDDLCTMMRLNSVFHDLAAPFLYDRAVVPCITAFMRNIETAEVWGKKATIKVIKPGIKTKKDMLGYVREIHLVYYPTIFEPTYKQLLKKDREPEEDWSHVGMSEKKLMKLEDGFMLQRATHIAGGMTLKNDILAAGNDFNPFPRLETVTVGANGDQLWEKREKRLAGSGTIGNLIRQQIAHSKSMLFAILSVSQPKHVCLHTMYGLSSPPTDSMFNPTSPNRLESFNVHVDEMPFDEDTYERYWPAIICGTVNRWHWRFPITRFDIADGADDNWWSFEGLASVLNSTYKQFKKTQPFDGGQQIDLQNTTLEICGFGNSEPWSQRVRAKLPAGMDQDASPPDAVEAALEAAYEKCYEEDEATIERLQADFDKLLCTEWKGKVSFMLNDYIDPCEGCGDLDHSEGRWLEQRIFTMF